MRALTIRREWAWLIAAGHKRIENRTWATSYRGDLLIHAGLGSDAAAGVLCRSLGIELPTELPAGVIVAVCELVDVVEFAGLFGPREDPFAAGPWCWMLENVRPLAPIPCRGAQGLWKPPGGQRPA